jgi:hypothetical protein
VPLFFGRLVSGEVGVDVVNQKSQPKKTFPPLPEAR